VVARRQRYAEIRAMLAGGEVCSINDLITYNLDIRQFAQDAIEGCEGVDLLRAFYKAISRVTVLDPTCGSGAFLFAALSILQPLYEACLQRMAGFVSDADRLNRPNEYQDFRKILREMEHHPNQPYFILKSIIINNLYGVDIMEEAVEIAKLRLFLKLAAQLESVGQIEPLPDIDFNIRAGNTLVGFATHAEVERAITSKMDFDNTLERIEQKAKEVERNFRIFRELQTRLKEVSGALAEGKRQLQAQLAELNEELNRYLASEYGIDGMKHTGKAFEAAFEKWQKSHQPFHWYVEFYGIIQRGGFDVVIGNPPYVEYNKVKNDYTIKGYQTESCGNLYAFVMERILELINNQSRSGMIVPMSGHSTERMEKLVKNFYDKSGSLYIMNISGDANPSILFPGVKFRLAVFLIEHSAKAKNWFATRYTKWFAEGRPHLFSLLTYTSVTIKPYNLIPKISHVTHQRILAKLFTYNTKLGLNSGNYITYYNNTPVSWIRSHPFIPYFHSERDGEKKSTQLRPIAFSSYGQSMAATAVICSSLFYIWWLTTSDCYHLNNREVENFPINLSDSKLVQDLAPIVERLMEDFRAKSKRRVYIYETSGRVEYDEFYPKHSKSIIDEIDRVLAQHYGFTEEELDFIINYDIKYRMGKSSEGEGEE